MDALADRCGGGGGGSITNAGRLGGGGEVDVLVVVGTMYVFVARSETAESRAPSVPSGGVR